MITSRNIHLLTEQWAFADSWNVYALVRLYDPAGNWHCYLYACDPDNQTLFRCLCGAGDQLTDETITFDILQAMYNANGDGIQLDLDFRPRLVSAIWKQHKQSTKGTT